MQEEEKHLPTRVVEDLVEEDMVGEMEEEMEEEEEEEMEEEEMEEEEVEISEIVQPPPRDSVLLDHCATKKRTISNRMQRSLVPLFLTFGVQVISWRISFATECFMNSAVSFMF